MLMNACVMSETKFLLQSIGQLPGHNFGRYDENASGYFYSGNGGPMVSPVLRTGFTLCQSGIGFLNWTGAREVFLLILDCYERIKFFDSHVGRVCDLDVFCLYGENSEERIPAISSQRLQKRYNNYTLIGLWWPWCVHV